MNTDALSTIIATEYTVRKILSNGQSGQLLAGPFTSEQEAESKRDKYPESGVFQETWLS